MIRQPGLTPVGRSVGQAAPRVIHRRFGRVTFSTDDVVASAPARLPELGPAIRSPPLIGRSCHASVSQRRIPRQLIEAANQTTGVYISSMFIYELSVRFSTLRQLFGLRLQH